MKKIWITFTLNGKEICAYSYNGTFLGELDATKELLAAEHNVPKDEIEVKIVKR